MSESWKLVLARQQIADLAYTYAWAIDHHDWDLLDRVFLADVAIDYEGRGRHRGIEKVKEICRGVLEPLDASQHIVSNSRATVSGDAAQATCYFQAQHVRIGTPGGDNYIVAGTYTDVLRRVAGEWRIAERTLRRTWTSGNPAVVVPLPVEA
jgi:hypothetical protein